MPGFRKTNCKLHLSGPAAFGLLADVAQVATGHAIGGRRQRSQIGRLQVLGILPHDLLPAHPCTWPSHGWQLRLCP